MKTKNSKKVLALILSFFMILTVLPFNVMAEGADPAPTKTTAVLKQEAITKIGAEETKLKAELEKVKDPDVKKTQTGALTNVVDGTKAELDKIKDTEEVSVSKPKIDAAMAEFDKTIKSITQNVQAKLDEEKKAQEQKEQEDAKKVKDAKAEAISKLEAKEKEVKAKIDSIKDQTEKEKQQKALKEAVDAAKKAVNDVADTSKPEDAEKTINTAVAKFETKAEEVETAATAQIEKEKKAEEAKKLEEAKNAANTELDAKAKERKAEIDKLDSKVYDIEKSKAKVEEALKEAKAEVEKAATKEKVTAAKDKGLKAIEDTNVTISLGKLSVSAKVYYDAITGKVTDKDDKAVEGATVSVFGRTTKTDAYGNFSFNMTKESGNYYCGYYGYYWKDYPYNSSKVTTTTGYYKGYNNSSYGRYFFLVDAKGAVVNSVYAKAYENYYLSGDAYTNYTVYSSEYGYNYGYNYGYPYYDKYYNRYYNPKTDWAYGKTVTATKDGYEAGYKDLYNVTNNSWLYTTCYEYGYPYGYDRVIYPSALSLSGNGTIVSGKVGVSYLPIYVYRNGVFLGSGNADVNGYFSIGLNSRVSSTSDLTFYAYGKTEAPKQKEAEHGTIPMKATVAIGSTKLFKNINGVESEVNMDVSSFLKDGRTMLPLRYIAEALGFEVEWDRATRTITLTDKEFKVQIPVETNKIIVNGSTYYSDAKPVIRNNRTMLPIANIARALGLKDGTDIIWDASARVATITRLVKY